MSAVWLLAVLMFVMACGPYAWVAARSRQGLILGLAVVNCYPWFLSVLWEPLPFDSNLVPKRAEDLAQVYPEDGDTDGETTDGSSAGDLSSLSSSSSSAGAGSGSDTGSDWSSEDEAGGSGGMANV